VVAATMTEPSGWTNPLGAGVDVESDAHQLACAYHQVTAAEEAAVTTAYTATNWYGANVTGYVQGAVVRDVDRRTPIDSANSTFNSGNTTTPHVLASLTGTNLTDGSRVLSSVAKDSTGAYSSVPAGWSQIRADNTNQGRWLGYRAAVTATNVDVTATNITPSAGDEYASITLALTEGGLETYPAQATSTGTGYDATVWTSPKVPAGQASATGTGYGATVSLGAQAGHASASSSLTNPTVSTGSATTVNAGEATGTGTGYQPTVTLTVAAGHATSSGTAYQPTISTTTGTAVSAGHATATGTAYNASTLVKPSAEQAAALATAYNPAVGISRIAGHASGSAVGYDSTPAVYAQAGHAVGVAVANQPTGPVPILPSGGAPTLVAAPSPVLVAAPPPIRVRATRPILRRLR
jgi:hypothetical protein